MQVIITDPYYLAQYPSLQATKGLVISTNQPTPEDIALHIVEFGSKRLGLFEDEIEILKAWNHNEKRTY